MPAVRKEREFFEDIKDKECINWKVTQNYRRVRD